jgi:hypothetical protein
MVVSVAAGELALLTMDEPAVSVAVVLPTA